MIPTDDELDALLKRLHLASARRIWPKLVERAEKEQWSYRDFLGILVAEEIAQRQQTRLQRLSRRAVFPFLKTIDDFDFTYQSTLRLSLLGSALSSDFITEGRCLILSGKPGRGKTHLAVAIAYRAIQNGFDAVFTTAAQLIDELSAAFRAGGLAAALAPYTHPALLVVDEVGYLTYGTDAANMLFHVVNDRHRRKRSMIFTTNKSLNAWGRVLHDEDLAQAIVDRVLERGRLLTLDGPSIRTKHLGLDEAQAGGSNQGADLARISGIARPEFPEPPAPDTRGGKEARMKPILSVVLLLSSTFAAGAAHALDGYPPPTGVVAVRLGAGIERLWPFTGTDFSGVPSDPINLVFLGDADPRIVRQTLLALDGDRTAFGLPNVFPLNCTWSDAIGKNQTAYARSEGWQGSAIQLQCGAYSVIRFHLRLFREGKRTLGNAHFEVMIPGTTDHEALSQEFAEAFVKLDLMRSGALEGPPSETAQISPAPSFGTIRPEIFNGVLPFIAPLLPLLGLPTTPQSAPIPVPSNGKASVFHLEGSVSREPTAIRIEFEHPFNQTIPKPFCSSGPLDYLKVQGPLHMVQEVHIDDLGRYSTRFETAGVLDVTPVNPLTGQPTGPSYQAVVGETHLSSLSLHRSEAHNTVMQTLLSETPQSNFENFWAGDIDHFVLIADCGP